MNTVILNFTCPRLLDILLNEYWGEKYCDNLEEILCYSDYRQLASLLHCPLKLGYTDINCVLCFSHVSGLHVGYYVILVITYTTTCSTIISLVSLLLFFACLLLFCSVLCKDLSVLWSFLKNTLHTHDEICFWQITLWESSSWCKNTFLYFM